LLAPRRSSQHEDVSISNGASIYEATSSRLFPLAVRVVSRPSPLAQPTHKLLHAWREAFAANGEGCTWSRGGATPLRSRVLRPSSPLWLSIPHTLLREQRKVKDRACECGGRLLDPRAQDGRASYRGEHIQHCGNLLPAMSFLLHWPVASRSWNHGSSAGAASVIRNALGKDGWLNERFVRHGAFMSCVQSPVCSGEARMVPTADQTRIRKSKRETPSEYLRRLHRHLSQTSFQIALPAP
jgi:hypothetical protein